MGEVSSKTIDPADVPMPQQLRESSIEGDTCDVCSHYYFIAEARCAACPWLIGRAA